MPITPTPPYPKSPGDSIRSQDWNQAVDEVIRLDNEKVDRAGDTIAGNLSVTGNLTVVGTLESGFPPLRISDSLTVGPFNATSGVGGIDVTGPVAELGFVRRSLTEWPGSPAAGDRFVWYNPDGTARLWTHVNGDLLQVNANGNLSLTRGNLSVPKTVSGSAVIGNAAFFNESSFQNNIKVHMGAAPITYDFRIGHSFRIFGLTLFSSRFSVNQDGDVNIPGHLTVSGGKTGYVVDNFINNGPDELELGDVIVIPEAMEIGVVLTGKDDNIPVFEVELCAKEYDTHVCGIVSRLLTEADLPTQELKMDPKEQEKLQREFEAEEKKAKKAKRAVNMEKFQLPAHPLKEFAPAAAAELERTKVSTHQVGQMVTLGAFSHCKVDADIAPIHCGDLLTTSPTKGHAQKVQDRSKAVGAIIGKALASRSKGKGIIPILVLLQ